jgi:hypothetical protein
VQTQKKQRKGSRHALKLFTRTSVAPSHLEFFWYKDGCKHPTNFAAFITAAGNLQRGPYKDRKLKQGLETYKEAP